MRLLNMLWILLAAAPAIGQQATGQNRVDFHTYSADNPDQGVRAKIFVIYPDDTTESFDTPPSGKYSHTMKRCDATVKVKATSFWGTHTLTKRSCNPIPVKLPMHKVEHYSELSTVLKAAHEGAIESVSLTEEQKEYLVNLGESVREGSIEQAAFAANELQYSLATSGNSDVAYPFSLFAQSAGFAAFEEKNVVVEPVEIETTEERLFVRDPEQGKFVMTIAARDVLIAGQQQLGIEGNGTWDGQTFQKLLHVSP